MRDVDVHSTHATHDASLRQHRVARPNSEHSNLNEGSVETRFVEQHLVVVQRAAPKVSVALIVVVGPIGVDCDCDVALDVKPRRGV